MSSDGKDASRAAPVEPSGPVCPNCRSEAVAAFCQECGQDQRPLEETFAAWVGRLLSELLDVDGRTLPTLRTLTLHPGRLTDAWLTGRRAAYLSPIRLYLVTAAVFFITWPFLVDDPGEGVRHLLPAWYFLHEPLGWGLNPQRFDSAVELGFQAFMLFFSVPLVAWINKDGWGVERGSSFMAQLVLSLHVHAVILALLTVAGGTVALLGAEAAPTLARTSVLLISLVYFAVACRTVLGRTWLFTITRAALTFCIYGPVMFIGLASFALLSQLAR